MVEGEYTIVTLAEFAEKTGFRLLSLVRQVGCEFEDPLVPLELLSAPPLPGTRRLSASLEPRSPCGPPAGLSRCALVVRR